MDLRRRARPGNFLRSQTSSGVSIDKTTFQTARPSIRSAGNMEDSFSHGACFRQTSGLNPCFGAGPTTTDHRLDTGESTSRSVIHIIDINESDTIFNVTGLP